MYAIVEIAGQQFKVEKGQEIYVHRLENAEGDKVSFDSVMMIDNNGKLVIGTPVISGAQVNATVVEHMKGDKVFVFHKKRRKGYKKFNGHREYLSLIKIDEIIETGATPVMKEEKKKEAPAKKQAAAKKPAAAKKETTAKKSSSEKKKEEVKATAKEEKKAEKKEAAKAAPKKTAQEKKAAAEGPKAEEKETPSKKEEGEESKEEKK